ncbi:MAG: sigma-54-dependent Fis family transcriptional regulator [Planctomycetes bacterium]|nr:sigma-54-dependent Fis family transcriptional regulator [Planctomycetota bacterium]
MSEVPAAKDLKKRILIVDDDVELGRMCVELFASRGYSALAVASGKKALEALEGRPDIAVVLTDLVMPDMDGLEVLKRVKQDRPTVDVVVMTSYGTVDNAVEAMKQGATDYITKPFKRDLLIHAIERIFQTRSLEGEVERLRTELHGQYHFENILGQNYRMQKVYGLIRSVADTAATVLVGGETGTGKELVAKAIHYNSARRDHPFVKVDCAALTETLLESELFGHVKGAYTGATRDREGRFRVADRGTIFLDEISNVPLSIQAKLLRVLQDNEFEPVGGDATVKVDVRIIAATNADLSKAVDEGQFRRDLFYRLNVVNIHLPPLRERLDDIPLLVMHFLVKFREKNKRAVEGVSRSALSKLRAYQWPGNVRELENLIERAVILCPGSLIQPEDLPLPMEKLFDGQVTQGKSLEQALEWAERHVLLEALHATNGDKEAAAAALKISRAGLYAKIKKHGLSEVGQAGVPGHKEA